MEGETGAGILPQAGTWTNGSAGVLKRGGTLDRITYAASIAELRVPPGNHLERPVGDRDE